MIIGLGVGSRLLGFGVGILMLAATAGAAPHDFANSQPISGCSILYTPTVDVRDAMSTYLGPFSLPVLVNTDALMPVEPEPLRTTIAIYEFPRSSPGHATPPLAGRSFYHLASFAYPEVTGLADTSSDERSIPFGDTIVLGLGPGGFGQVMTGRSIGGIENWSHASETALSYIRPHVNVQMMFALEIPGTAPDNDFEGPGAEPHAYLTVDHQTRVNSADIGSHTDRFGGQPSAPPVDEPHTALAAGLDLGILPTFLAQMGMNVAIVASRGQDTGDLRIALVGTTELPVDWRPHERPYQHPTTFAVEPILTAEGYGSSGYGGGGSGVGGGGGGGGGGSGGGSSPITPVIPEPVTLSLLGTAAVAVLAGLKRHRTRHTPDADPQ